MMAVLRGDGLDRGIQDTHEKTDFLVQSVSHFFKFLFNRARREAGYKTDF
jgi:hypothetical protein